jgi:hypothetical protein
MNTEIEGPVLSHAQPNSAFQGLERRRLGRRVKNASPELIALMRTQGEASPTLSPRPQKRTSDLGACTGLLVGVVLSLFMWGAIIAAVSALVRLFL